MAPTVPGQVLQMGQSPGTHWYHAHKHGSTAINVANGMTGAFVIEGKYDDEINATYGAGWTRKQPVLVINQLGVSPNLLRKTPTDKGPDFSVNGGLQPVITMYPGEVQMWRILNTSGRSGAFFVGPPAGFEWMQLAQDGVQFADPNYQKSRNRSFLMASGNRVDLLVKAPLQPQSTPYNVLVMPAVAKTDLPAQTVTLLSVQVTGQGPEMHFLKRAPSFPSFLADIGNDEIRGTKTITFNSLAPGSPFQHTINGQPFSGEVGVTVLLDTAEEWKIANATNTATGPANIDHPFHIHINPFQVTEVFDPNEMITDPATQKPVNKYVFSPSDKTVSGQCVLDPNSPESCHPCSTVSQPYRIWWDVFPIPSGRQISVFGRNVIVPGYFKMRSRFVDYPGLFVLHCHILAHEDRGMMTVVEVRPRALPYAHH
jgi:FtsP/CotA-like multicopper oxidase with cupredoxin domain